VVYLYMTFFYKFPTESNGERIVKIGQYLVKLWARVRCLVFLTHGVVSLLTVTECRNDMQLVLSTSSINGYSSTR